MGQSYIAAMDEARAETDAYIVKHGLDKKYKDPRQDVEDDDGLDDLLAEEDGALLDLCDGKYASDDEFFRTVEYVLKVKSRFAGLAIGDMLTRHLKRRKTFRRKRQT
jgi:hypothetical protein